MPILWCFHRKHTYKTMEASERRRTKQEVRRGKTREVLVSELKTKRVSYSNALTEKERDLQNTACELRENINDKGSSLKYDHLLTRAKSLFLKKREFSKRLDQINKMINKFESDLEIEGLPDDQDLLVRVNEYFDGVSDTTDDRDDIDYQWNEAADRTAYDHETSLEDVTDSEILKKLGLGVDQEQNSPVLPTEHVSLPTLPKSNVHAFTFAQKQPEDIETRLPGPITSHTPKDAGFYTEQLIPPS
jgi:PHP family Zn ribbon phosphoesterase